MKILIVGDSHGNDNFIRAACEIAAQKECTKLFQVGDFGYWAHYKVGQFYLDECRKTLKAFDLEGYFLDGNHENHPLLWSTYGPDGPEYDPDNEGFWRLGSNLAYAPRTHRWTWDDLTFMSLGGAYSIDKEFRTEGIGWWPEEAITNENVIDAIAGGPVDVMLTHDAPESADVPLLRRQRKMKKDLFPESTIQRVLLQQVVDACQPKLLVHGHYHERYTDLVGDTLVVGLGADMSPLSEALWVLDTEDVRANSG